MIKKHSDDPNVAQAADQANGIVTSIVASLPKAERFDYGGHDLRIGEYDVCAACTTPIAEAQQAQLAFRARAGATEDPVIKEHLLLAAELFEHEAKAAVVRAEFHNGIGTEKILDSLLEFIHDRSIKDDYSHSHHGGK